MDMGLDGRTVLITGASRNIGRRTAVLFAREGANLAICTRRSMERLNQTASEVEKAGARVITGRCDVTDADAVASFVKSTCEEFGSVDVVVNNAAYRSEGDLLEDTYEKWIRNIEVNLNGPYHICKNTVPYMIQRKWGRIINFSGIAPYLGTFPGKAMVKLGIVGFTRGLAKQFGEHNITANCIGPGRIDVKRDAYQKKKDFHEHQLIRRCGTPDEVASLVIYLASEMAGYITGQCYLVNGGAYLQ
jgi:3-oxoacyl-[acyl-carrier protein] reductase